MCLRSACESTVAWQVLSGTLQQLQKFWKNCRNDRCQWPKCFTLNAREKQFLWLLRLDCFLKNTTWQRPITTKIYLVRRHWQNGIVLPNQYFWLGPWSFNFMISLFLSFCIASEYACVLDQPGRLSRFKRLFGVQVSWVDGICRNVKSLLSVCDGTSFWHGRRPVSLPLTVLTIRRQAWGGSILLKKGEPMHLTRLQVTDVFIYCWLLDCETTNKRCRGRGAGRKRKTGPYVKPWAPVFYEQRC